MGIEKHSDHAVMTFARANPPTTGHAKLFKHIQEHAHKEGADHHIFLSHTQDAKKNPLSHKQKREFIHKMVPHLNVHEEEGVKTPIDALKHLHKKGYKHVTIVVGGDRHQDMSNLVHKYNGKDYHFHKLEVKSAGERDPDAEGVEGMSASKMREHATKKNFKEFTKGVIKKEHAKELYHAVRKGMKLENYQAVFLVGGPGSGKDFVLREALHGATEISLDKLVDAIRSNENMEEIDGRPVILNGTADLAEVTVVKAIMEAMSYQTTMVFVYTTNEASFARTKINEAKRAAKYDAAIEAMHEFKEVFAEGFFIFDNSQDTRQVDEETKTMIEGWLTELPTLVESYYKDMAKKGFHPMRADAQLPPPKEPHPVPVGYERIKDGGFWKIRKLREDINDAFETVQIDEVESGRTVVDMEVKKQDTAKVKQGDKYKHNGIAVAGAKDNERVVQEEAHSGLDANGQPVYKTGHSIYPGHQVAFKDYEGKMMKGEVKKAYGSGITIHVDGAGTQTVHPARVSERLQEANQEVSVPQEQAKGVKYTKKNPAKGAKPPAAPYNSNIGQVPSGGVGLSTSIGEAKSFSQFRKKKV